MDNKYYEITNPQKSIWLTEQVYKGTSIENITGSATIQEKVNFKNLNKAINLFIKRNDSFRFKFIVQNDVVKQYIAEFDNIDFEKISLSSTKELKQLEHQIANTVFEPLNSYLFDFKMFEFPNGEGGFIASMHHLISDAWSAGLLVSQIMDLYSAICHNLELPTDSAPSYINYIKSEQEYLNSNKFKNDELFWTSLFQNVPEIATIPSLNSSNSTNISCASKRKHFTISKKTIELINSYCKENKFSIFNFFMGIFSIYIGRVSNLDEFVIRYSYTKQV